MDISVNGWVMIAGAALWAVLVVFLCVALISLFRVLTATRDMLEDFRRETTPMLHELNATVGGLNREIDQVDEILSSVRGTTAAVEGITKTVQATIAHPAIRALAIAAGAGKAWQRLRREKD